MLVSVCVQSLVVGVGLFEEAVMDDSSLSVNEMLSERLSQRFNAWSGNKS